jgi:hypothetical protein
MNQNLNATNPQNEGKKPAGEWDVAEGFFEAHASEKPETVKNEGGTESSYSIPDGFLDSLYPPAVAKKEDYTNEKAESEVYQWLTGKIEAKNDRQLLAFVTESEKLFTGGVMPFHTGMSQYNPKGVQYGGIKDSKTGELDLHTKAAEIRKIAPFYMALAEGTSKYEELCNAQLGAKIGMTGAEYGNALNRDIVARYFKSGTFKESEPITQQIATMFDANGITLFGQIRARKKLTDYADSDVVPRTKDGRYHFTNVKKYEEYYPIGAVDPALREVYEPVGNIDGKTTLNGKVYKLVTTENGERLEDPYFISDDGDRLEGAVRNRAKGDYDTTTWELVDMNNPIHSDAIRTALKITKCKDMNELGEMAYRSGGRILDVSGDKIYARKAEVKDGVQQYRLELAKDSDSFLFARLRGIAEERQLNERNALKAMHIRLMLAANPEIIPFYQQYKNSQNDNVFGKLDRKGDVDALFDAVMNDMRPYLKEDNQLTPDEIAIRDKKMEQFHTLVTILGMEDRREGARNYGDIGSRMLAGTYNSVAGGLYTLGSTFRDGALQWKEWLWDSWGEGSEETFSKRFEDWAKADLRAVTQSELFSEGTIVGGVSQEVANLIAFGGIMKIASAGKIVASTGKSIEAFGKAVHGFKYGNAASQRGVKIASAGRKLQAWGRAKFGGEMPANVEFRKWTGKTGKQPKNAVKVDEEWFVPVQTKVNVGPRKFYDPKSVDVAQDKVNAAVANAERIGKVAQDTALAGDYAGLTQVGKDIAAAEKAVAAAESELQSAIGSLTRFNQLKDHALLLANQVPALSLFAGSHARAHIANSAYKIGEKMFADEDATGFDPSMMDVIEDYAVYDAAGNTLFMMGIPKIIKQIANGAIPAASNEARAASRRIIQECYSALGSGNYYEANAIQQLLRFGFVKGTLDYLKNKSKIAAHGFGMGVGMSGTALAIDKMENRELGLPDDITIDEGIEVFKSGLRMGGGMVALGAGANVVAGVKSKIDGGDFKAGFPEYNQAINRARLLKGLDRAGKEVWLTAIGMGHKAGKRTLFDASQLHSDPKVATKQILEKLMKDKENFDAVSADVKEYITSLLDFTAAKYTGLDVGNYEKFRDGVRAKYGETFTRVLESIGEQFRERPDWANRFKQIDYVQRRIKQMQESALESGRKFEEYTVSEVSKLIESAFGTTVRKAEKQNDGTYRIRLDVNGKEGGLYLHFKPSDVSHRMEDGSFNRGWVKDIVNALNGRMLDSFPREDIKNANGDVETRGYADLMDEFQALTEKLKQQLVGGKDVNGILTRVEQRMKENGGGDVGYFIVDESGKKVVVVNKNLDSIKSENISHETGHGIIQRLRDYGIVTEQDEIALNRLYKTDAWEELFLADLFENRITQDIIKAVEGDLNKGSKIAAIANVFRNIFDLLKPKKIPQAKKTTLESFLEKKVEEARTIAEEERIEEVSESLRKSVEEEMSSVIEDAEQSEMATSLVVSNRPIPNEVMFNGVKPEDVEAKKKQLNASGFYYDSHHDMWVNKHSAPTLFHRAVNEAIAVKVKTRNEMIAETIELFRKEQGELAERIKAETEKGSAEEVIKALREKFITENRERIRKLVTPEEFTKAETEKMGIVVAANGEPLGVVVSEYDFINDGKSFHSYDALPPNSEIVPYSHDLYGRWAVKGVKKKMSVDLSKERPLICTHSCTPNAFIEMMETDQAAGISGALTKPTLVHPLFGAISLFMRRVDVDPKTNPWARVFLADVGTADYPFEHKGDAKAVADYFKRAYESDMIVDGGDSARRVRLHKAKLDTIRSDANYKLYTEDFEHKNETELRDFGHGEVEVFTEGSILYGESKNYDSRKPSELFAAALIPKFREKDAYRNPDIENIKVYMESNGYPVNDVTIKKVQDAIASNPALLKSLRVLRPEVEILNRIKNYLLEHNIPFEEYEIDNVPVAEAALSDSCGLMFTKDAEGKVKADEKGNYLNKVAAQKRLLEKYGDSAGIKFGVIGSKGAYRYFADSYNDVLKEVTELIDEAIVEVDVGTRRGLASSKNAILNDYIQKNGNQFGPFYAHVGGTDGDKKVRLEYNGRKPTLPKGFVKRIKDGEMFTIRDIMGNFLHKDEILAKAYPEIMSAPIYVRGSKIMKERGVKEPAWLDDNISVLANENNEVIFDTSRFSADSTSEHFAQAIVGMIGKAEGWEPRVRTSDSKAMSALTGNRAKRQGSNLAFWLMDSRFINGNTVGPLVEKAIRRKFGDKVDDAMLKKVADAITSTISDSIKNFAGEAEARFLAKRFWLSEDKLKDYSSAEEAFKNTLVVLGDTAVNSQTATKKVLEYWDNVILKAVDVALYGRSHVSKDGEVRKGMSIRPQFREAIAEELLEGIIKRILEGTRAVRRDKEGRIVGLERGEKLAKNKVKTTSLSSAEQSGSTVNDETGVSEDYSADDRSVGSRLSEGYSMMNGDDAAWDNSSGGRTLMVSGDTVTDSIDAKAKALDVRWETNKNKVVEEVKAQVAKMKSALVKDPSKAQKLQAEMMSTLLKSVAENCLSDDITVHTAMLNEAITLATKESAWGVVGSRRTPKQLLIESASARLAKMIINNGRLDNHKPLLKWIGDMAKRIGVKEVEREQFVQDVFTAAKIVAETLVKKHNSSTLMDSELITESERQTAMHTISENIVKSFLGGYKSGAIAEDTANRAVREAKRIQTRNIKDAKGYSLAELNSMLNTDICADIENMATKFGSGDALAAETIKKFADKLRSEDSRFTGMTDLELEKNPIARQILSSTVSGWLKETARRLGYGQVREWAMKEAVRMKSEPPTFGMAHAIIAKHADRLSAQISKQNVSHLIDTIDKFIDDGADGSASAKLNIPDYERTIAPRLQDYWKYVKKVMRMTPEATDKEIAKYTNELKLSEAQLRELSGKEASGLDPNEELIARETAVMRLNALLRYGGLAYRSFAEVRAIFDNDISRDIAGAAQLYAIKRATRIANDAKIRQAFIGELTAMRTRKFGDEASPDNGTSLGNFLAFSIPDLFRRMQLYLHEGSDAWNFIDSFRQDMSIANIEKTMFISNWEGELRRACKRIYGVNFERLVRDMMIKKDEYSKFSRSGWIIDANDAPVEVNIGGRKRNVIVAKPNDGSDKLAIPSKLSKANLIYIYAACQQADMQVNNFIFGRDAKYFKEIEDVIGPEGIAMADWLTSAYGEMRKKLNPISEDITGMQILSPDEKYCPLQFIRDNVSNDERRFASSPFPSFLTRRITHDSLKLSETMDAFRMFEDRIQDAGHYLGFAKIIDRMNTTLKHPKVQTAFSKLYGNKAKNDIYAQLADALNGGRKNSDSLLNGVRNFVTATSLFGNIGSSIKQLEGIGGWAIESGLKNWLLSLVRTPMTSSEVRQGLRELIDAGLFRTRVNEGISEAMVALMNSCEGVPEGPISRTYRWYKRHGMDITKFVDKIASMSMAGQYYVGRKNFYIEGGLKEADAKRRALADTDYAIQVTQQSGRPEFLHSAQRSGTAGKVLTQFTGPSLVRWGIECEALHRAFVMGDKGAWSKLMSKMIALHIICPSILALAGGISGTIFRRDDQKMKDIIERTEKDIIVNCLTGPMTGWFIWGQIMNAFAYETVLPNDKTTRNRVHFEAPVLSKLHSLQSATSKMFRDVIKASPWEDFSEYEQEKIAEDALKIMDMVIPALRVKNPIKRAIE